MQRTALQPPSERGLNLYAPSSTLRFSKLCTRNPLKLLAAEHVSRKKLRTYTLQCPCQKKACCTSACFREHGSSAEEQEPQKASAENSKLSRWKAKRGPDAFGGGLEEEFSTFRDSRKLPTQGESLVRGIEQRPGVQLAEKPPDLDFLQVHAPSISIFSCSASTMPLFY